MPAAAAGLPHCSQRRVMSAEVDRRPPIRRRLGRLFWLVKGEELAHHPVEGDVCEIGDSRDIGSTRRGREENHV
jgi:hypothetical protein